MKSKHLLIASCVTDALAIVLVMTYYLVRKYLANEQLADVLILTALAVTTFTFSLRMLSIFAEENNGKVRKKIKIKHAIAHAQFPARLRLTDDKRVSPAFTACLTAYCLVPHSVHEVTLFIRRMKTGAPEELGCWGLTADSRGELHFSYSTYNLCGELRPGLYECWFFVPSAGIREAKTIEVVDANSVI